MTVDELGRLHQSTVGGCANYNPDKTRPLNVEALDVKGLDIFECLNHEPTEVGNRTGACGSLEYCSRFKLIEKRYSPRYIKVDLKPGERLFPNC